MKRLAGLGLSCILCAGMACCTSKDRASPMDTAKALLKHHNLLGKKPTERTDREKRAGVSHEVLGELIADLEGRNPFLTNLYVGFVVGALASNQNNLSVTKGKNRAKIEAGQLNIRLLRINGSWKISLGETIPDSVKRRARQKMAEVKTRTEAR